MTSIFAGGYHFPNTARLWAYLTSLAVQHTLTNEIPEHEVYITTLRCHATL